MTGSRQCCTWEPSSMNLRHLASTCALGLCCLAAQADTMRCGSNLVISGDRGFAVERQCGPPADRGAVGYALGRNDPHELRPEERVVGPDNARQSILDRE